jgi:hypothetical protein
MWRHGSSLYNPLIFARPPSCAWPGTRPEATHARVIATQLANDFLGVLDIVDLPVLPAAPPNDVQAIVGLMAYNIQAC